MRKFRQTESVYLCTRPVDMRKSINGLAGIVQGSFQLDPYDGDLFVFCNRNRDKIKVLQWDQDGFVLYYKRREKGRFPWPLEKEADGRIRISRKDLYRLLGGLVMEQFVQRRNYAAY